MHTFYLSIFAIETTTLVSTRETVSKAFAVFADAFVVFTRAPESYRSIFGLKGIWALLQSMLDRLLPFWVIFY
jgi:hypothetical protein